MCVIDDSESDDGDSEKCTHDVIPAVAALPILTPSLSVAISEAVHGTMYRIASVTTESCRDATGISNDAHAVSIASASASCIGSNPPSPTSSQPQLPVNSSWKSIFPSNVSPPLCSHGERTVERTVTKAGANFGRKFYVCGRPAGLKTDINAR